jgi:polyketide biosynthesis acyl carrier protein
MSRSEILNVLREKVKDILFDVDENTITEEASLKELGLNSIDRSDVLMDMCDELDIRISMIEFAGLKNIGEIISLFESKLN